MAEQVVDMDIDPETGLPVGLYVGGEPSTAQTTPEIVSQPPTPATSSNVRDSEVILAATSILNNSAMSEPVEVPSIANSVPSSATKDDPAVVFNETISGSYGARLASISVAVDAVFQTNYKWLLSILNTGYPSQTWQSFDPTVNTFEEVPSGKYFIVKAGTTIQIKAYNNTGTSSDGIMSVYLVYDQLTSSEAAILSKYDSVVASLASSLG